MKTTTVMLKKYPYAIKMKDGKLFIRPWTKCAWIEFKKSDFTPDLLAEVEKALLEMK